MTRQSTKQHGVSLVEVMLTLAISSLLITTVLAGRNSLRSQAQFSDGIERIKETILSTKSEANTSNNKLGKGTSRIDGASDAYAIVGQSLFFDTDAKTTMRSANVLCYGDIPEPNEQFNCGERLTSSFSSRKPVTTPWNIQYTGYTTATTPTTPVKGKLSLVFMREEQTGSFTGSWYTNEIVRGVTRATVQTHKEEITLHFASSDGRNAIVVVNPSTGTVTRTIQ